MYQIFCVEEPLFVGEISNDQHSAVCPIPFRTLRIEKKRHFIKYRGTEITKEGFRAAAPTPKLILKKTQIFLDTVTSDILRDLPFSRSQQLKLTDDQ